jgi:hypothetical protein
LNLRWAGAFAAAILAAIIGFSVVARQESRRLAAREAAVPVTIDGKLQGEATVPKAKEVAPASPSSAEPQAPSAPLRREAALDKDVKVAKADAPRTGPAETSEVGRFSAPPPAPPAAGGTAANEPLADQKKELSDFAREPSSADRMAAALRADAAPRGAGGRVSAAQGEKQGGEGAAVSTVAERDQEAEPVKLILTAADGGAAPEAIGDTKVVLPPGERGHEYLLVVDAQGRVSEVRRVENLRQRTTNAQRADSAKPALLEEAQPPQALKELRFRPADRPRVFHVKIE